MLLCSRCKHKLFLQCMTIAATFVEVVVDASYKIIPFISIDICIHSWLSNVKCDAKSIAIIPISCLVV